MKKGGEFIMFTNIVIEFIDFPWICYAICIFRYSYTFSVCQAIINSNKPLVSTCILAQYTPPYTHTYTHTTSFPMISILTDIPIKQLVQWFKIYMKWAEENAYVFQPTFTWLPYYCNLYFWEIAKEIICWEFLTPRRFYMWIILGL